MIKIPTLFKKDPNNLAMVIDEVNPGCEWVFEAHFYDATRKFQGTAAAIIDGILYKRYDIKKDRPVPIGAIPCQRPDTVTGHWPHWVKCDRDSPEDKYFWQGYEYLLKNTIIISEFNKNGLDGTYELCGPKVEGSKEGFKEHELVRHGADILLIPDELMNFNGLKAYLEHIQFEGIVFHHDNGNMCKIRKSDFGFKR